MAIWALVLGIAGFLLCGVVLGPLAVVLGFLARQRIRTEATPGEGIAVAAIVVGAIAFALNVVVAVVLIANPELMDAPTTS